MNRLFGFRDTLHCVLYQNEFENFNFQKFKVHQHWPVKGFE